MLRRASPRRRWAGLFEQEIASDHYRPDLSIMDGSVAMGRRLFDDAGISRDDIDVAMIYDAFSPILLMQLEALGFCGLGEAKDFVADGNLAVNGVAAHQHQRWADSARATSTASTWSPRRCASCGARPSTRSTAPARPWSPPAEPAPCSPSTDRSFPWPASSTEPASSISRRASPAPVAGMLLADHGADVVKVEPPGGDPWRSMPGSDTWLRGRRSIELDLTADADRATFADLAAGADVVLTSYRPGVAEKLGVDATTLLAANPRLIVCSISAYGHHPAQPRPAGLRTPSSRRASVCTTSSAATWADRSATSRARSRSSPTWRSLTTWRPGRPAPVRSSPPPPGRA